MAEKSEVAVDSTRVSDADSAQADNEKNENLPSNWNPGYLARFPVYGAAGLLGVLICAVATIIVLLCSNNMSSTKWRLQPSIIIQGLNSLSNLCLALAIGEGVAIAWWRKAVKGATVAQLHRSWASSISFSNIVKNFWRLDAVALAALAAKLAIVDGILFQRASTTYVTQDPARNVTLLGAAAQTFPQTGFVVAEGFGAQTDCDCFMIGDSFTPTVDVWETSNGFFKNFDQLFPACDGICYSFVDAIGFEIDCQKAVNHSNYATSAIDAYDRTNGKGDSSQWSDLPIFNASFGMRYPDASQDYPSLVMDLLYFDSDNPYDPNSSSCPGNLTNVQCSLRPALIRYPLTIVNYTNVHITNGVTIGGRQHDDSNTASPPIPDYNYTTKQADGFTVLSYLTPSDQNKVNSTTQLGGIANALSQFMSSSAAISYKGSALWGLTQKGILAQSMMFGPPNMGSCDCSFRDALSTLVSGINQLTFLTATSLIVRPDSNTAIKSGTTAPITGITTDTTATFVPLPLSLQISDVIHYKTHFLFMGLGLASTLICLLLIIPAFWRYGELGRPVTLGPMEIASAFRAPMLETGKGGEEAAGNLQQLMKQVGGRKVVYGFLDEDRAGGGRASVAGNRDEDGDVAPAVVGDASASASGVGVGGVPGGRRPGANAGANAHHRQSVRLCMEEPTRVRPVSRVFDSSATPPMSPVTPKSGRRFLGVD